jgi:hypothetical protein
MITFTILVCVLAILFRILFLRRRKVNGKEMMFCECKIYGKFMDSEIPIDDIKFFLVEISFE